MRSLQKKHESCSSFPGSFGKAAAAFTPLLVGARVPVSRWFLPGRSNTSLAGMGSAGVTGGDGMGMGTGTGAPGRLRWRSPHRRVTHGELDAAQVRAGTAANLYISPRWSLLSEHPSTALGGTCKSSLPLIQGQPLLPGNAYSLSSSLSLQIFELKKNQNKTCCSLF